MNDWLEEYLGKTMIKVEGGDFMMGKRNVMLDDFMVNKYPVTQELYEKVMRKNPSYFKGKERPVEQVDWYDAIEFSGGNKLDEVGWYNKNNHDESKEVGLKEPNQLGLYDMSGNVWEWCWDWYGDYKEGTAKNPRGADSGERRVVRGGSWGGLDYISRVAYRFSNYPVNRYFDTGFRISRAV